MTSTYEVTAEFYDVLHAASYLQSAAARLDRWLGTPTIGVIDVGAGTGLGTVLLAARCGVPVHAVEPAASMRAVLLSRLAGRPALLSRVHLHTCNAQDLNLSDAVDFALCLNTMGTLDASLRSAVLDALARALVPGGRLLVERPPTSAEVDTRLLPSWQLGDEAYGGTVTAEDNHDGTLTWRFDYQVRNADAMVRTARESFTGYVVSRSTFDAGVVAAGFEIEASEDAIVVARRSGMRPAPNAPA